MSRILITGAAGFVGSNLMDVLDDADGFDNYLTGRRENVSPLAEIDITDRGRLYAFANIVEPRLIIHCAASYKDPDKWHLDTETNIAGAINVAAVAKHHGAHVIYFQTVLPPISSYAISKIAAEHYLRLSGVPLTVFKLAAIYGPRNISGAIPTFYRQIAAGEPCTVVEDASRDFVFIEDLTRSIRTMLMHPKETWQGTRYIRSGTETPIRNIPYLIGEMLDIEPIVNLVPRREDDVAAYEMDGPAILSTPFVEGLQKAVDWYERNGVTDTFTHLRIHA